MCEDRLDKGPRVSDIHAMTQFVSIAASNSTRMAMRMRMHASVRDGVVRS